MNTGRRNIVAAVVTAAVLSGVVGVAAGSALGVVPGVIAPEGVIPAADGVAVQQMPEPSYSVNDSGQSVGSVRSATSPENEPDLISVMSNEGRTDGYVLKSDLDEANGTTAMKGFTSPEDAIRWQEQEGGKAHTIPVYLSDGTTAIGTFTVGGGTGDPARLPPLGQ